MIVTMGLQMNVTEHKSFFSIDINEFFKYKLSKSKKKVLYAHSIQAGIKKIEDVILLV